MNNNQSSAKQSKDQCLKYLFLPNNQVSSSSHHLGVIPLLRSSILAINKILLAFARIRKSIILANNILQIEKIVVQ